MKTCGCIVSCECLRRKHKCEILPFEEREDGITFLLEGNCRNIRISLKRPRYTSVSMADNHRKAIEMRKRRQISRMVYDKLVPNRILLKDIFKLSVETSAMVRECLRREEFLPLRVGEVRGKGLGLYATDDILPNTLVCVYVGEVRESRHCEGTKDNDSIMDLGFIGESNLIIQALECSNIARFINNDKAKPNCQVLKCALQQPVEPCILIWSLGMVYKGEEITYYYGEDYP